MVESDGAWLFLHRAPERLYGGFWGCPTGKVEPGEARKTALGRELHEETGWAWDVEGIPFCETLYVRHPELDFVYHLYAAQITGRPSPRLNRREHTNFAWLDLATARLHALVPDMDAVLDRFEKRSFDR
ncbi:MAG: NUDIX domain-containing protein [Opitutales bacterium]|nr:NUDIX domain-containing protein [Opitutales bacterium]